MSWKWKLWSFKLKQKYQGSGKKSNKKQSKREFIQWSVVRKTLSQQSKSKGWRDRLRLISVLEKGIDDLTEEKLLKRCLKISWSWREMWQVSGSRLWDLRRQIKMNPHTLRWQRRTYKAKRTNLKSLAGDGYVFTTEEKPLSAYRELRSRWLAGI